MFDVISSNVKWLHPRALRWAASFILSEVGPKKTLGWELITFRHEGRESYSRAQYAHDELPIKPVQVMWKDEHGYLEAPVGHQRSCLHIIEEIVLCLTKH